MTSLPSLDMPSPESPEWLPFTQTYVSTRLDNARARLDAIRAGEADDVTAAWNDADILVDQAATLMETLAEVHPEARVRTEAADQIQRITAFTSERDGDPELYAQVERGLVANDPESEYLRTLVIRDFHLQGAHLGTSERARVAELSDLITAASTEFSDNIRGDVASITVPLASLSDMPADYIEAHAPDEHGMVTITTDYPDMIPVLDMCSDRDVREALMRADYDRAPDNDEVLARLLRLRDEKARLLGFDGWPDYATAPMMMDGAAGIEAFLDDVAQAARPAAAKDAAMLLERLQQDHPEATAVKVSDSRYYLELIKSERFGVDARHVREYVDYSRVRDGILELASDLFSLSFTPVPDASRWAQEVEVYDVHRTDGQGADSPGHDTRIGRIHLDMHPRAGKYGHMACFGVVGGIAQRHLAEAALVCNFPRGKMTFDDLETFLHEFGHLMHGILSGQARYARLAGLSERGEWDFVEAPSQMLEEWAFSHDILRRFCVNDDGEEIPAALVDAIRASRDLGGGLLTCRQLVYAQMSYRLHRDIPTDLAAASAQIEAEFDAREPLEGTHQYRSFGHLTTYSACYYTYQWSLAIAKDLFTGFDPDNLLDATRASHYRDAVLAPGGSKPAAQLIEDFLGRPFTPDAYQEWLASLSA